MKTNSRVAVAVAGAAREGGWLPRLNIESFSPGSLLSGICGS
ncbi:hypothetical protein [Acinetobacter baumannii]